MIKTTVCIFAAMKQYLLTVLLPVYAMAHGQQTKNDSIPDQELDEITIVASNQHAEATKTVYLPTARQRAAASDGMTLLGRMNIPQLSVNPVAETVMTADNQDISIFINFHPATARDIAGIDPADVKQVEYLDFPTDARFLRARHVVNFITRVYAYGGYTKLNAKERFMVNSGEASLYSRFSYRSMEYDLMLSGDYDYNGHIGSESDESYRFTAGTVRRLEDTESGRHHERGLFAGLRASWNRGTGLSFRNLVSFRRIHAPEDETSGHVWFYGLRPALTFTASSPFSSSATEWNSSLYADLGKGWTLDCAADAEIRNNRTADSYITNTSTIENHADENAWFLNGNIQLNKSLSEKCTVFANALSGGGHNVIGYSGSGNATNRFTQIFTGVCLGLSLNLGKISGSVDGGYAFESNSINRHRTDDRYPFTHINMQYAPDKKNSISIWAQYATFSPDASMKNPNLIRQSELMYITGNPDLTCSRHITVNLSYIWLPDNHWQMSAYTSFFRIIGRQIAIYAPEAPDGMMLKKYHNDGTYNHGQIGTRITGRFFDGRLSLSVSPRLLLYRTTGAYRVSHFPFTGSIGADYYHGDFFFSIWADNGFSYVDGETAFLRRMPAGYSFTAGWASKGWNLQISLVNPFRSSWETSKDSLVSQWYDNTITQFGATYHRRISLTATYTFSYGRKIVSDNELTGDNVISTSILK